MNTSLSSLEKFALQLQHRSTVVKAVESSFMFLINFASLSGNLLLGIAVVRNPTLRRTVPNMYIIALAVSDFLMSLVGIPLSLAALIVGEWPFNNFICQVQGFWNLNMCAVSLQTLAVTAVNRYVRVVRSRSLYQKLFNFKTTKVTIVAVWFMALFAPSTLCICRTRIHFPYWKSLLRAQPCKLERWLWSILGSGFCRCTTSHLVDLLHEGLFDGA